MEPTRSMIGGTSPSPPSLGSILLSKLTPCTTISIVSLCLCLNSG